MHAPSSFEQQACVAVGPKPAVEYALVSIMLPFASKIDRAVFIVDTIFQGVEPRRSQRNIASMRSRTALSLSQV